MLFSNYVQISIHPVKPVCWMERGCGRKCGSGRGDGPGVLHGLSGQYDAYIRAISHRSRTFPYISVLSNRSEVMTLIFGHYV